MGDEASKDTPKLEEPVKPLTTVQRMALLKKVEFAVVDPLCYLSNCLLECRIRIQQDRRVIQIGGGLFLRP